MENSPITHRTNYTDIPVQTCKEDIEIRFQQSIENHLYAFPRASVDAISSSSSLKDLADAEIYNLHSQNPRASPNPLSLLREMNNQDPIAEALLEIKSAGEPSGLEAKKKEVEGPQQKCATLAPRELLNLYRQALKMNSHETSEKKTSETRPESMVDQNGKKNGDVVMKVVKTKSEKEAILGMRPQQTRGRVEKKPDNNDLRTKKQVVIVRNKKENTEIRKGKELKNFPKSLMDFSKDFESKKSLETTDSIVKKENVDDGRQMAESDILELNEIEERQNGNDVQQTRPKTSGNLEVERKETISSKGSRGKSKRKGTKKLSSKQINLYLCYTSSKPKQIGGTKVVNPYTINLGATHKKKTGEKNPNQVVKPHVKTVEIVRETGEIKEVKEKAKEKEKPLEKTREATREATIEKQKEKAQLDKPSLTKKPSSLSTQVTERVSASKNVNKAKGAEKQKGNVLYSEIHKKQAAQKTVEEKKKRDSVRDFVSQAIALAKATPKINLNMLNIKTEYGDCIKNNENKVNNEKFVTEVHHDDEGEKDLAMSNTFGSPFMKNTREDKVQLWRSKVHLHVITQR